MSFKWILYSLLNLTTHQYFSETCLPTIVFKIFGDSHSFNDCTHTHTHAHAHAHTNTHTHTHTLALSLSFGCALSMWKFWGQGWNPCHSSDPNCFSDNTRYLTGSIMVVYSLFNPLVQWFFIHSYFSPLTNILFLPIFSLSS